VRYSGTVYQIDRQDIRVGMRNARVHVEDRLDGTIAERFQGRYVRVSRCAQSMPASNPRKGVAAKQPSRTLTPVALWATSVSAKKHGQPESGHFPCIKTKKPSKTLDGYRSLFHTDTSLRRFAPI
jgi:hypothetical protein